MKFRKDTPEKMKRLYKFLCVVLGAVEGTKRYKKYCRSSSEKMLIFKYGRDEGRRRYREVIKNVSFSRTKDAYIQKYGKTKGTKLWKEKNSKLSVSEKALRKNGYTEEEIQSIKKTHADKSKHTLETYVNRYGDVQGPMEYERWLNEKRVSVRSVNELVDRLGWAEEQAKEYVRHVQSRGLEFFVEKYGIVEGTQRYVVYNKKRLQYPNAVSKPQMELCQWLAGTLVNVKVSGVPVTEQPTIKFSDGTWMFPDIVVNDHIAIEFNGEYWHKLPEIVEKDAIKAQKLEEAGYVLIVVWYNDYVKNKEHTQHILLEQIYENQSNKKKR
jgi:very-short-patch-repair endonuclease/post-segregation antitoxin (ccd killing protein)